MQVVVVIRSIQAVTSKNGEPLVHQITILIESLSLTKWQSIHRTSLPSFSSVIQIDNPVIVLITSNRRQRSINMNIKSSNDSFLTLACHNEITGLRDSIITTIDDRIFINNGDSWLMNT